MKNRNVAMLKAMKESQGTSIDGQQMFELLSAVSKSLESLQKLVGGMLTVQERHNESIITISNSVKEVANQLALTQEFILKEPEEDNIDGIFLADKESNG